MGPFRGSVSRRAAEVTLEKEEMWRMLRRLLQEEEGQNLMEYALIAALTAIVVIAALTLLGGGIQNVLNSVVAAL